MNIYQGKNTKKFYLASLLYDSIDDNNFSAVKYLLCEKGADPNVILPTKTISPLHLVIGCDDETFALNVTKLILQNGGNPNVSSDDGLTPVHIAAAWGKIDILKILLSCGGDPEFRDSNRMTPIHYAVKENYLNCVDLLKSFLPANYDVLHKEKEDCFHYKLEKLIVNNDYATGEYEVCNEITSIKPNVIIENLENLPKPDTTKYVLSWFDTHIDDRGGQTYIKNVSSLGNSSGDDKRLPYESSIDESANEDSKDRMITFKKPCKRKMKLKQKRVVDVTGSKTKKHNCNKNDANSSGFNSAASENGNCIKEVSSESGIVTLPNSKESLTDEIGVVLNANNFDGNNSKPENYSSEMFKESSEFNYLDSKNGIGDELSKMDFFNVNELKPSDLKPPESSSDYMTCSGSSLLNKNIFIINHCDSNLYTSDESCIDNNKVPVSNTLIDDAQSTDQSFITISEIYKYEDSDEGIFLYEKRILKLSSDCSGSIRTLSSKMSSLPDTIDYDPDTLRRELILLGYKPPGPVTVTTKRVYMRKLLELRKQPLPATTKLPQSFINIKRVYSPELEKTLKDYKWAADLSHYRQLEEIVVKEFSTPSMERKWREGHSKSSFTYLLLDPRKTDNLPCRADTMDIRDVWETFLSAIFYVGKGKKTRPYSHLYEAVALWRQTGVDAATEKLQTILDIWKGGSGVICLHVFQNVIPVEAYTREAAMISALKIENTSNVKSGEFYGTASTWQAKQKRMFGTFLLYKAMMIFLQEGERQLYANDIATA